MTLTRVILRGLIVLVVITVGVVVVVLSGRVWGVLGSTVALLLCITAVTSLVSGTVRREGSDEESVE